MDEIIKGNVSNKKDDGLNLDLYYLNANYLFVDDKNMPTAKKLFYQELKNKGYNMLRDDYDTVTNYGAVKSPIILLDGEASLSIESEKVVNKAMLKKASKYCNKYARKGEKWANKQCGIT